MLAGFRADGIDRAAVIGELHAGSGTRFKANSK